MILANFVVVLGRNVVLIPFVFFRGLACVLATCTIFYLHVLSPLPVGLSVF